VSIKEPVALTQSLIHHQIITKLSTSRITFHTLVLQYTLTDIAPSAIATEIETPVSVSKTPSSSENHDVYTALNYTKRPGQGLEVIDSGIPESERRNAKRDELRDVQNFVIKDIRGR
jgi:hypothetical protein